MNTDETRTQEHRSHINTEETLSKTNLVLRIVFALFMIVVYVGMGVLLFINFFAMPSSIAWLRWIVGVVLVLYGIFRGYRLYKGIN